MKSLILLFFFFLSEPFNGQTELNSSENIRVGAFNYFPAIFKDNEGEVKGFIADILNEIGERENWSIEYAYGSWNDGIESIKSGGIDILCAAAFTAEREKFMDYTDSPILTVWGELYTQDGSTITSLIDLPGKRIALMKSDFNGDSFLHLISSFNIKCDIVYMDNFESIFNAVRNKEVDAGVVNNIYGIAKMKEFHLNSTGVIFNPFEIFFTSAKGKNSEILNTINNYLNDWKENEESPYHASIHHWTRRNVNVINTVPDWVYKLFIFMVAGIIIAVLFLIFLKSKINAAVEKSAENERRYKLAVEMVNDGVFDWNLITDEIFYSPNWKKIVGYEENEIKNEFSEWERLTRPEDVKKTMDIVEQFLAGAIDKIETENKMRHKNGKWVDVLVRADVVSDEKGKAVRIIGTHLDITERKNMERALIESNRLNAIGEMSAAVAHDFNNSLQTITSNADLAMYSIQQPEKIKGYLNVILNASSDSAERIKLLQRISGKRKSTSDLKNIDIKKVIDEVIEESKPIWKDNAEKQGAVIKIVKDYNSSKLVAGNKGELKSVFFNLIKNSIEAMPEGGKILIKTSEVNGKIEILVTDSGVGMTDDIKLRVFQPFFTKKGFEGGRGLGLSGALGVIKEHHGEIFVKDTALRKGTTFAILLPVRNNNDGVIMEEKSKQNGKLNILWVDDDDNIRSAALEMMNVLGHEGNVVSSGAEALDLLKNKNYDLIVTDIGMPNMNGWELAEKVKSMDENNIIAVLTGWGDQIEKDSSNSKKIDYVIAKPMSIKTFKKITEEVFKKNQS